MSQWEGDWYTLLRLACPVKIRRLVSKSLSDEVYTRCQKLEFYNGIGNEDPCEKFSDEITRIIGKVHCTVAKFSVYGVRTNYSLCPLALCANLHTIDLYDYKGDMCLDPLASCTKLHTLSIGLYDGVLDLSPLARCTKLHTIYFDYCEGLVDLDTLALCTSICALNLTNCNGVADLGPLASCTNLRALGLFSCRGIVDLGPLEQQSIENLTLYNCCESLALPKTIQILDLAGSHDIGPLALLKRLHTLTISCEGVVDLSPLALLRQLHTLTLRENRDLTDLGPLVACNALHTLNIEYCDRIQDLGPLASCKAIRDINIYRCCYRKLTRYHHRCIKVLEDMCVMQNTFFDI
jgi:hypothetical protein